MMKTKILLFLLLSIVCVSGCGSDYKRELSQADKIYEAGDRDAAQKLYKEAARKGSPEANFALAYKYNVTPEESIRYFSEAAKKGHAEALDQALDALLFRANSLERANPQRALELYKQAKMVNPALKIYDEEVKLKTIQMSIEPGEFDSAAFCKKYGVLPHNDDAMYYVWTIAEEASKGGRFGKPDPKLILQLVSRGGWAPAELEIAVEEAYKNWKSGVVKEFNICDYITSGGGMSFCASRADDADEKDRDEKLKVIGQKLDAQTKKLLKVAYGVAVKFIESKTSNEEGHGGSGRGAWILDSQMKQKNDYLELVEKVNSGFKPEPKNAFIKADQRLNATYKNVIAGLKKQGDSNYEMPRFNDVRDVQRLWIPYRDATVKLFMSMNPSVDEGTWKSWLTEIREKQLKEILSL